MGMRLLRGAGSMGAGLACLMLLVAVPPSSGTRAKRVGPQVPRCRLLKTKYRHGVRTVIGEMNMSYAGGTTSFSYGQGADSDISTAVSINGGPFQIDGSKHVSTSTTATGSFSRRGPYARKVIGLFTYVRKTYNCRHGIGATATHSREVHVEPVSWDGSIEPGPKLPHALNHCDPNGPFTVRVPRGYKFVTSTERATLWSAGASVFGAGLRTQSGFSTRVVESIQFPSHRGRYYLCGTDGPPAQASRLFTGIAR